MSSLTEVKAQIAAVDREIDAVSDAALARVQMRPRTASGWQKVWDRCPDLLARFNSLYTQRGALQQVRDGIEYQIAMKAERAQRASYREAVAAGAHR